MCIHCSGEFCIVHDVETLLVTPNVRHARVVFNKSTNIFQTFLLERFILNRFCSRVLKYATRAAGAGQGAGDGAAGAGEGAAAAGAAEPAGAEPASDEADNMVADPVPGSDAELSRDDADNMDADAVPGSDSSPSGSDDEGLLGNPPPQPDHLNVQAQLNLEAQETVHNVINAVVPDESWTADFFTWLNESYGDIYNALNVVFRSVQLIDVPQNPRLRENFTTEFLGTKKILQTMVVYEKNCNKIKAKYPDFD